MSDIIQEIRSGNKEAIKSVYQQYAKDVYNFSKSITGDHDTALAATKKTFLNLFRNIRQGEDPQNLRTAALKIAYDEAYRITTETVNIYAALQTAYDDAFEMPIPNEDEIAEQEPTASVVPPQPAAPEGAQPELNAEPMFQRRTSHYAEQDPYGAPVNAEPADEAPAYEEPGYEAPAQEEIYAEPPAPAAGLEETLKIQPVSVEKEHAEMRDKRRLAREAEFQSGAGAAAPAQDAYAAPAQDAYAAPAQDAYAAPAQDAYAAPAQDAYAAPAQDVYAAPAQDVYAAPAQDVYAAPAQDAYAAPAQENLYPEAGAANDVDVRDLDADEDGYTGYEYDDLTEKKPRSKGLFVFCIILNIVLIVILLWFLGGLLVNLGVLPDIDLGYSWFNAHIYPLF